MRPIDRLQAESSVQAAIATLDGLNGPDLTSVLLEVMKRRSAKPSSLPASTRSNRFTRPAPVQLDALRRVEDAVLSIVPSHAELIVLAPAAPLGAHVALGGSSQDRLVSAVRRIEMAGDPTIGLALEAAARRSVDRGEDFTLASIQRVTRAQVFDGANSFAHFTIFGMVTAGRDRGDLTFERASATEHVKTMVDGVLACGGADVEVNVMDTTPDGTIRQALEASMVGLARVVAADSELGEYYDSARFGVSCVFGEDRLDIGDGGFTTWTAAMLSDRKERLCISGLGLDRIAIATG